jgi:hypothetical protein
MEQKMTKPNTGLIAGTDRLVTYLQQQIEAGQTLRHQDLINAGKEYLGADLGAGLYDPRYLYDAIETALHRHIESRVPTLRVLEPAHIIDYLEQLLRQLPTQRIRTNEQSLFQQFSTPAPLAFTANFLAFLNQATERPIVLEPSAGTAAIACIARGFGAQVISNDLSVTSRLFNYLPLLRLTISAENINDYFRLKSSSII